MADNDRKIRPEHMEISEMMKNKQSRCEDWVAAIANVDEDRAAEDSISVNSDSNDTYKDDFKIPIKEEYDDNEEDPLSESIISSHRSNIGKTPDLRGIPEGHSKARLKLNILLCCEWLGCTYMTNGNDKIPMNNFVKHVMEHLKNLRVVEYEDESRVYKCDWQDCDHTTTCNSEIKRHLSMHAVHIFWEATAVELHNKWKFPVCQKIDSKENKILDIESSFICETVDCSFSTDNFYEFTKHVENDLLYHLNSNDKPWTCIWKDGCNFKSNSPAGMKIHMKKHTGEKRLKCPTCKTCFTSTTKYVDHCTKDMPIRDESNQCQFCLRFYANERLLRDHMRYHINSHKCSFCGMTFSTPNVLSNHIRLKHLDYRPFECLTCGFRSIKAVDHNKHLKVHKADFEYKCTYEDCEFQCRTSRTFKNHNLKHNNQKKPIYKCHLCTKEFKRGDILGKHLRGKHNLERLPGHTRFRYTEHKDGYFRVQIERYESTDIEDVKASPQLLDSNHNKNIFVKQEDSSERQSPTKLTIKLDNSKQETNNNSLEVDTTYDEVPPIIMIDEIDENGRLIRSNPIMKELSMESLPECARLVETGITGIIKEEPDDGTTIVRLRKRRRKTKFGDLNTSVPHEIIVKQ